MLFCLRSFHCRRFFFGKYGLELPLWCHDPDVSQQWRWYDWVQISHEYMYNGCDNVTKDGEVRHRDLEYRPLRPRHKGHHFHDDVIKWKHFPRYWPFVWRIHRSPVNSPQKGQWRKALIFSFICAWKNGWVNNREAGNLRRYRAHYAIWLLYKSLNKKSSNIK